MSTSAASLMLCCMAGLTACGAAPRAALETPTWERPGLGGAVRPEMGSPQPNEVAPDFTLPKTAGGELRLSSLRGSWVVMHFTATWCPYCDAEIAHLGEIANDYAPHGVKVVVIALQEDHDRWVSYSKERLLPSVTAVEDKTGAVALTYAPPHAQPSFKDRSQVAFDTTLIVDPHGVIRLFLLPDTAHFDPKFGGVRGELDRLVGASRSRAGAKDAPVAADVLDPEDVVRVDAHRSLSAIDVRLEIAPGYHIMSDHPTDPYAIATVVRAGSVSARFPSGQDYRVGDKILSTFSGSIIASIPSSDLVGPVTVRYQACTASRCLAPITREVPTN